jgi:predicted Rossmann fold nucleotide-binding protein DprA/Smf involved in DNA uptake
MPNNATVIESASSDFPAGLRQADGKPFCPRIWAIGDLRILDKPTLGFFCSARCPGEVILRTYDAARALRKAKVPVIGGFHSPMEKEFLDLLLRGTQPIVVCPARSIVRMRIPASWRAAVTQSRMLILSPFGPQIRRPTSAIAEQRNCFAALLANQLLVAHAASGSMTEKFCLDQINGGKRVLLLEGSNNEPLISNGACHFSISELAHNIMRMS